MFRRHVRPERLREFASHVEAIVLVPQLDDQEGQVTRAARETVPLLA
jgi:hypothetical protein